MAKWKGKEVASKNFPFFKKNLNQSFFFQKVKCFFEDNLSFSLEEFKREVAIMSMLKHENLVPFYGACTQASNLFIVLQFMQLGNLRTLLTNPSFELTYDVQLKLATDVAEAMTFLHLKGVIHRDLKSLNVLIDKAQDGSLYGRLSDFGCSKIMQPDKTLTKSVGTM